VEDGFKDRLQNAINDSKYKKVELARLLGVSVQAVGQWMKTGYIAKERLPKLASILDVSLAWLMTGKRFDPSDGLDASDHAKVAVLNLSYACGPVDQWMPLAKERSEKMISLDTAFYDDDFIVGDAFAIIVPDNSMIPVFSMDDYVIVSKSRLPMPGDYVLAASPDGRDKAMLRKYREISMTEFELVPANDNYPTVQSSTKEPTWYIAGVISEHRRCLTSGI
jgi:SOS-response transcriptional repressor LexA